MDPFIFDLINSSPPTMNVTMKGFLKTAPLTFTFMGGTSFLSHVSVCLFASYLLRWKLLPYFFHASTCPQFNAFNLSLIPHVSVFFRVNHHIVCTLRGYRRLDARFDGQPIIGTGFKMVYDGHSQLQSGPLPAGNPGEFDVITCQDLDSGELQQFKLAYD